jgi:hypothetical protein
MISISRRTLSSAVDTNCDSSGGALAGDAITERGARGLALGDGGAISGDAGTAISIGFGEAGTTDSRWPEPELLVGVSVLTERKEDADAARLWAGAAAGGASEDKVDWAGSTEVGEPTLAALAAPATVGVAAVAEAAAVSEGTTEAAAATAAPSAFTDSAPPAAATGETTKAIFTLRGAASETNGKVVDDDELC